MKAYQFLNKFLYASSDTKHVFIHPAFKPDGEALYLNEIADPADKENHHRELLEMTVSSFCIRGKSLIIYTK